MQVLRAVQGERDLPRAAVDRPAPGRSEGWLGDVEPDHPGGRGLEPDEPAVRVVRGLPVELAAVLPSERSDDRARDGPALGIHHAAAERPARGEPDDLRGDFQCIGEPAQGRGEAFGLDRQHQRVLSRIDEAPRVKLTTRVGLDPRIAGRTVAMLDDDRRPGDGAAGWTQDGSRYGSSGLQYPDVRLRTDLAG